MPASWAIRHRPEMVTVLLLHMASCMCSGVWEATSILQALWCSLFWHCKYQLRQSVGGRGAVWKWKKQLTFWSSDGQDVSIRNCFRLGLKLRLNAVRFIIHCISLPGVSGFDLNDLYMLDLMNGTRPIWTNLSDRVKGAIPSSRAYHGFASEGGYIYVFAGTKIGIGDYESRCKVELQNQIYESGLSRGFTLLTRLAYWYAQKPVQEASMISLSWTHWIWSGEIWLTSPQEHFLLREPG